MNEAQITNWLHQQGDILDKIIAEAAKKYEKDNCHKYNFKYDLNESQKESFYLSQGKDLCYDRPTTAFVYSLYYQARRINTFLKFFLRSFLSNTPEHIHIYDLGAGTGSVQFSVGLIMEAIKVHNGNPPKITITNVDSSQFMLDYSKDYLWPEFIRCYPSTDINIEYSVNSWDINHGSIPHKPWITASYLFDISDNVETIKDSFLKLISYYKPSRLLLLSSYQDEKKILVDKTAETLRSYNFEIDKKTFAYFPIDGDMTFTNNYRKELYDKYGAYCIYKPCFWRDNSFHGVKLVNVNQELDLTIFPSQKAPNSIYLKQLKIYREVELSDEQKKAIRSNDRPSLIIGPAGSGKTVVIAEKIKNIVHNEWNYHPDLRILFATFNKKLVTKIGDWVETSLDVGKAKRYKDTFNEKEQNTCSFTFTDSEVDNILMLNFDVLANRLCSIKDNVEFDLNSYLNDAISEIKATFEDISEFDSILNPTFVLNEYHRVIYGKGVLSLDQYLDVERSGMRKRLIREQRIILYRTIENFIQRLRQDNLNTIFCKRKKMLEYLNNKTIEKFDYIFVDEFQDCTETDYRIFYEIIKNLNNITFAGDLAQSIHVGRSSAIPKDERMNQLRTFRLEGSFRIPLRISECIKPLSHQIFHRFKGKEINNIAPVKNSPPGARVIVVYGETQEKIASKISQIWGEYTGRSGKISIMERDEELRSALYKVKVKSTTHTIMREKGLEMDCVLWSTRTHVEDLEKSYEFVYTILTRSSNILIIALFNETLDEYKRIIKYLREDRLIIYDQQTKDVFSEFCERVETELPNEEDDE